MIHLHKRYYALSLYSNPLAKISYRFMLCSIIYYFKSPQRKKSKSDNSDYLAGLPFQYTVPVTGFQKFPYKSNIILRYSIVLVFKPYNNITLAIFYYLGSDRINCISNFQGIKGPNMQHEKFISWKYCVRPHGENEGYSHPSKSNDVHFQLHSNKMYAHR